MPSLSHRIENAHNDNRNRHQPAASDRARIHHGLSIIRPDSPGRPSRRRCRKTLESERSTRNDCRCRILSRPECLRPLPFANGHSRRFCAAWRRTETTHFRVCECTTNDIAEPLQLFVHALRALGAARHYYTDYVPTAHFGHVFRCRAKLPACNVVVFFGSVTNPQRQRRHHDLRACASAGACCVIWERVRLREESALSRHDWRCRCRP